MAINLYCDCGNPLVLPDSLAGRKVKCKVCGAVLRLPDEAPASDRPDKGHDDLVSQSGEYDVVPDDGHGAPEKDKEKAKATAKSREAKEKGSAPAEVVCPSCGAVASSEDTACLACGAELGEGSLGFLDAVPRPVLLAVVGLLVCGGLGFAGYRVWQASRPSAYTQDGIAALAERDFTGARRAFEAALEYDRRYGPAVVGMAELAVESEDGGLVRSYVPRALPRIEDARKRARIELAYAQDLLDREQYRKAYNAANDAGHDDPELPGVTAVKGLAAIGLGETEDAVVFLEEAVAAGSDDYRVYHELASIRREAGEVEEALRCVERAVELRKDDPGLWLILADLREQAGRTDAAKAALAETVELEPDNAAAHSKLSRFYLDEGDLEASLESAEKARDLAPESVSARVSVGRILLALDRPRPAQEELDKALDLGESWEARFLHGKARARTGAVSTGAREMHDALRARREDAGRHLEAGRCLLEAHGAREARAFLQRAVQLDAGDYEARLLYARALGSGRSPKDEEVVEQLEAAVAIDASRAEAHLALGKHLAEELGDTEGAIAAYDRGLEENERSPELLYWKGRTCVTAKRWDEAVQALEALQRIEPEYEDAREWRREAVEGQFYDR